MPRSMLACPILESICSASWRNLGSWRSSRLVATQIVVDVKLTRLRSWRSERAVPRRFVVRLGALIAEVIWDVL